MSQNLPVLTPALKLEQAKRLMQDGQFTAARPILVELLPIADVRQSAYQNLLNLLAFSQDIEGFIQVYLEAIEQGLGGKVYLNQFYYNALMKIQDAETSKRLAALFQSIIDQTKKCDKFTYLSLSYLYTKSGDLEQAIAINQQCVDQFVLKRRGESRYREQSPELRKPDFILIGTLKSGTTSLYDYLLQHPRVKAALLKEVRFFSSFFENGIRWYLSHFPRTEPGFVTGEATPGYFSSFAAPGRLYEAVPDAKLILCLRHPTARTLSHYHMDVREGRESRSLAEIIAQIQPLLSTELSDRLPNLPHSFSDSLYAVHLQRWLEYFPSEQICIIRSEDLFQAPEKVLDTMCDFLGIERFHPSDLSIKNEGRYQRLDTELETKLSNLFAPYNQKLKALTGIDFTDQIDGSAG